MADIDVELTAARQAAQWSGKYILISRTATRFATDWMLAKGATDVALIRTRGLSFFRALKLES